MEENKEEKVLTKKELKLKAEEMKLEAKQKKMEEKAEIKAEKERRKNSFGRKVKNFILTIIFTIILLCVGFYFANKVLIQKQEELSNKKMSQIYQSAEAAMTSKDYKKAIELLKQIDKSYEKYSEVESKLKEAEQLYLNEYLTEADEYLKSEKFEKALKVLDGIEDEFKESDIVKEKRSDIKIAMIKSEVAQMAKDEETNIAILDYLLKIDSEGIEKVEDSIDELISQYKNAFILETRELLLTDYKKAKSNVTAAKKILPDDKDIKKLAEEVDNSEAKSNNQLTSLKSSVTAGTLTVSDGKNAIKGIDGTEYKNYILKPSNSSAFVSEATIEFSLDKKYKALSGEIHISELDANANQTGVPQIIFFDQDDNVIYTANDAEGTFSFDVTNVEKIKIKFAANTKENYFIANPTLTAK